MFKKPNGRSKPTEGAERSASSIKRAADNVPPQQAAAPAPKRCFVISPIGAEGSPVRRHMDDVFYCFIKPAMAELGYDVERGDHKSRPGRITDQIIRDILGDQLIICVLTGANPNVYYEFAIAESAGRPIVVLKQRDEPIPFDVKDVRIIEYDLEPRNVMNGTFVKAIVQAVRALEEEGLDKRVVPFAPELTPLGAETAKFEMAPEYNEVSSQEVLKIAEGAEKSFDFCGMALKGWSFNEALFDILRRRCEHGLSARIMIMHEDNPALRHMLQSTIDENYDRLREEISTSGSRWQLLAENNAAIEFRKVYRGIIYHQAAISEGEMLWTPHLMRFTTGESPALRIHRETVGRERGNSRKGLHSMLWAVQKEYDHLWRANILPADQRAARDAARNARTAAPPSGRRDGVAARRA